MHANTDSSQLTEWFTYQKDAFLLTHAKDTQKQLTCGLNLHSCYSLKKGGKEI